MKTVIIGLDAFDPVVFERLHNQGRMPNLGKYVEAGGYARLAVSNPPQSEVSWTSLATGAGPGVHGLFDFVHRDPATYALYVSLLPTRKTLAGIEFARPHSAHTLFDEAVQQGYSATALWWPATFPARYDSPVRTLPGLGTPDIAGRLGVGTLLESDGDVRREIDGRSDQPKTAIQPLERQGGGRYIGKLLGPSVKRSGQPAPLTADVSLSVADEHSARLTIGRSSFELSLGRWSPVVEIPFRSSRWLTLRAITRFILVRGLPEPRLYVLPLQLHPMHPTWRYAAPPGFARQTWQACGPYLTLGWPQDTTGLDEGWIDDEQFLALCDSIDATREQILTHHLRHFREGVLASVFDTLDRVQHMFWRERPDIVEAWYVRLDGLVGRIERELQARTADMRLVIVSDHGFERYDYQVHLNRWLMERGYLAPAAPAGGGPRVDWSQTRAYAIGLNSLYLNLAGREGQGVVTGADWPILASELRDELLAWNGPDGLPVVQQVECQAQEPSKPLAAYGPDLLVGYRPGYRASAQTGLGQWGLKTIEPNTAHWSGDHCFDANAVPGVVFCSHGLEEQSRPSYRDFPRIAIGRDLAQNGQPPPPAVRPAEDEAIVEERLKSLGYL
jgi:predicted AlkP superfamily phosphohydrolase/phosphomutase